MAPEVKLFYSLKGQKMLPDRFSFQLGCTTDMVELCLPTYVGRGEDQLWGFPSKAPNRLSRFSNAVQKCDLSHYLLNSYVKCTRLKMARGPCLIFE